MPPSKVNNSKLTKAVRLGLYALFGIAAIAISVSLIVSRGSARYTIKGHLVETLSLHNENFKWYSDRELLVGNVYVPYPEYHVTDSVDRSVIKFDPSHFAKSGFYTPSQLDYSSNHQLLLTSQLYGRHPWVVTMKQDGTDIMSHGIDPGVQQVWFRDNVHWATLYLSGPNPYVTISSVDSPIPIQTIDLGTLVKKPIGKLIMQAKVLGQADDGKLLIYVETQIMRGILRRSQSIYQIDSLRGDTKGVEFPIRFPDIANRPSGEMLASIDDIALSPDGKRLAYTTTRYLYMPYLSPFLLGLMQRIRGLPKNVNEIRVSNRDLSDMRIIGQEEITQKNKAFDGPDVLKWSPDGMQLAFRYNDAIWVIPAN